MTRQTTRGTNRRIFIAAFEREEDLLGALKEAKATGQDVLDVYAPYAIHGLPEAMGLKPSRLPWACLVFGVLGLACGLALQVWTSAVDWKLNVGGKPFNSLPAFVPVAFEIVVLFAGLGSVAAFLHALRLRPGKKAIPITPGVLDDRFALVLGAVDSRYDEAALSRTYRERFGAILTEERLVEDER